MEEIIKRFIRTLRSENTKKNYERYIKEFCEYKKISTFEDFKEIDIDDYYDWKEYLQKEKHNSENTLRPKLISISSFYEYLCSIPKYEINVNPISKSNMLKNIKKTRNPERITWLTSKERTDFLNYCNSPREKAMFAIFCNTAIRVTELIDLDLNKYVRYTNKEGKPSSYIVFTRKGGKRQTLYLNPYVTKAIEEYLPYRKESEYSNLFISNSGKPMTTVCIDRTIKKIAKRAGINKNISAHSFRRTVATDMHKEGVDLLTIQHALGHSSPNTTQLYIQDTENDMENIMMNYVVKGNV
jgi:integrase/recombinase XerD